MHSRALGRGGQEDSPVLSLQERQMVKTLPHLRNVHEDPQLSGVLKHFIQEGTPSTCLWSSLSPSLLPFTRCFNCGTIHNTDPPLQLFLTVQFPGTKYYSILCNHHHHPLQNFPSSPQTELCAIRHQLPASLPQPGEPPSHFLCLWLGPSKPLTSVVHSTGLLCGCGFTTSRPQAQQAREFLPVKGE